MVGKQTEERIEFDSETRKKVLQKTNFCCAACGEKLDMVRHTIDHIIPISRGGTNDIDNLIGLCKVCNTYKDNILYYPGDYYTYFMTTNGSAMYDIHCLVVKYLKDEVNKLDLHRYPVISPCCTAICSVNGIRPKGYIRQLLFDIVYMRSDMRNANAGRVKYLKNYAYYAVIKRTTQKLIAILRIDYSIDKNFDDDKGRNLAQITVFDEWSECSYKILASLMRNIGEVLSTRYVELGIPLDEVCIASQNNRIPDIVYNTYNERDFGWFNKPVYISMARGTLNDREELGELHYFCAEIDYSEEE